MNNYYIIQFRQTDKHQWRRALWQGKPSQFDFDWQAAEAITSGFFPLDYEYQIIKVVEETIAVYHGRQFITNSL